tara:strand:- start:2539 stop:2886 length:348 start_codon:yes stop_codon:yes gene_type:complete
MRDIVFYYLINLFFYIVEITSFSFLIISWPYDIFWLNTFLRGFISIFFTITVRKIIFKDKDDFYLKIFLIILLNPFASSTMLKILIGIFDYIEIWILKIIGDIFVSIIAFIILKK